MALTRQMIRAARQKVDSWSPGGEHYRAMDGFVSQVEQYFDAEEERALRLLPSGVLTDGMALKAAMDDAGLTGEIAELLRPVEQTPARYRITIAEEDGAEPLRLEGTVARLTSLLGRMAG